MGIFSNLNTLDNKILDILEHYCHKQQRFTGVTHFAWMRYNEIVWSAILMYTSFQTHSELKYLFAFGSILFTLHAIFYLPYWERKTLARMQQGLLNPQRVNEEYLSYRLLAYFHVGVFILFPVLVLLGLVIRGDYTLLNVLVTLGIGIFFPLLLASCFSFLVLTACDPLPPTNGRLWEKLRAMFKPKMVVST